MQYRGDSTLNFCLTSPKLCTVNPPSTIGKTGRPVMSSGIGCTIFFAFVALLFFIFGFIFRLSEKN